MSSLEKEDEKFYNLIRNAKEEFKAHPSFQGEEWAWIHELDDEGFFIFCYLVEDYSNNVISKSDFEQTVYTLVMLRHKLLPATLKESLGISTRWLMQPLFNLYENMKKVTMTWEDCEIFIEKQIKNLPVFQEN